MPIMMLMTPYAIINMGTSWLRVLFLEHIKEMDDIHSKGTMRRKKAYTGPSHMSSLAQPVRWHIARECMRIAGEEPPIKKCVTWARMNQAIKKSMSQMRGLPYPMMCPSQFFNIHNGMTVTTIQAKIDDNTVVALTLKSNE